MAKSDQRQWRPTLSAMDIGWLLAVLMHRKQLTSTTLTRCWRMSSVKIACDRDDWVFMFVLAVVRDRVPARRICSVCINHDSCHGLQPNTTDMSFCWSQFRYLAAIILSTVSIAFSVPNFIVIGSLMSEIRASTNLTEQISRFPGDSRRDVKKNPRHVCIASACYAMYRIY